MNLENPYEMLDRGKRNLSNEDLFFGFSKYKYHFYIEDMGKTSFYELFFQYVYSDYKKIKIHDFCDGKKGVIEHYLKMEGNNELNDSIKFLLDKDYEDKIPEQKCTTLKNMCFNDLKSINNFKIWSKTNVENYLLNEQLMLEAIKISTGASDEKIEGSNFNDLYSSCILIMNELSKYYMISLMYDCQMKKNTMGFVELTTMEYTKYFNTQKISLEKELQQKLNHSKEIDEIIEDISVMYDDVKDIDGKQTFNLFVNMLEKIGGFNNINHRLFARTIISRFTDHQKNEIKSELNLNLN